MSEQTLIDAFKQAMSEKGIDISDDIVADGSLCRVHADGDKEWTKNGWYVLHLEDGYAAGAFGHWAHDEKYTWSSRNPNSLTSEEKKSLQASMELAQKKRSEAQALERETCRSKAEAMWAAAKVNPTDHPYLVRKGIKAYEVRQSTENGALLVPIYNKEHQLVGLQQIWGDGTKRFLKGTPKNGNYLVLNAKTCTVLVCEGYGTGASLKQATGYTVVIAFDAGNLLPVAQAIREKLPNAEIVICADNDTQSAINTGLIKGREAAAAVGAHCVFPTFPEGTEGTDFNDMHQRLGLDAVSDCIDRKSPPAVGESGMTSASASNGYQDEASFIVAKLAAMSTLEYERAKKQAAKDVGITITGLDKVVKEARAAALKNASPSSAGSIEEGNSATVGIFEPVEPWHEPINTVEVLDAIRALIHRFIVIPEETAIAATLWIALTWLIDAVQVAPIAMITAPEKRCGKTQLLTLFIKLCYQPLPAANISAAAIYRCVEAWQPTLLIDEADAFLRNNEDARGILNSGHTRDTAFVVKIVEVGGELVPKSFGTFGPKAIAGIGAQAETLMDRSIVMELRRKLANEHADKIRNADPEEFSVLKRKLSRMAQDAAASIKTARPEPVEELNDRAQDNWEPLLAIADYAAGKWPILARDAALKLSGSEKEAPSRNEELLIGIRTAFESGRCTRITKAGLLEALCEDDEAPWATYNKGFRMTSTQLSARLRTYGIKAGTVRPDGRFSSGLTANGYKLEQFTDAFSRYLPVQEEQTHDHNAVATRVSGDAEQITESSCDDTDPERDLLRELLEPADGLGCDDVMDNRPSWFKK